MPVRRWQPDMKNCGSWEFRRWMAVVNIAACWLLVFGLAFWGHDTQLHLLLAQGAMMLLAGNILTYAGSKSLEAYFVRRIRRTP